MKLFLKKCDHSVQRMLGVPSVAYDAAAPDFLATAAARRQPTVITGVPLAWPALKLWPSGLCDRVQNLGRAFVQDASAGPVFYHESRQKLLASVEPARRREQNVTCAEFLAGAAAGAHFYISGALPHDTDGTPADG